MYCSLNWWPGHICYLFSCVDSVRVPGSPPQGPEPLACRCPSLPPRTGSVSVSRPRASPARGLRLKPGAACGRPLRPPAKAAASSPTSPPSPVICSVLDSHGSNAKFLSDMSDLALKASCKLMVCPSVENRNDRWIQVGEEQPGRGGQPEPRPPPRLRAVASAALTRLQSP